MLLMLSTTNLCWLCILVLGATRGPMQHKKMSTVNLRRHFRSSTGWDFDPSRQFRGSEEFDVCLALPCSRRHSWLGCRHRPGWSCGQL